MHPEYLKKDGEYPMEHIGNGLYQTTRPEALVPKIGNSKPKKKIFTYQQLIELNYI